MVLCSNCLKEIKHPKYFVVQLGYLCPDCSKQHGKEEIKKIQCEINKLQKQISNINQKMRENVYANCEHEFKSTGYVSFHDDKMFDLQKCIYCGLRNEVEY